MWDAVNADNHYECEYIRLHRSLTIIMISKVMIHIQIKSNQTILFQQNLKKL